MKLLFTISCPATSLKEKLKHPHVRIAYIASWLKKNDIEKIYSDRH